MKNPAFSAILCFARFRCFRQLLGPASSFSLRKRFPILRKEKQGYFPTGILAQLYQIVNTFVKKNIKNSPLFWQNDHTFTKLAVLCLLHIL